MYSFVAIGAVTIFVWDLFFPDLLDVFVLSTLSIERRTLFTARIAAVGLFLGIFLLGTNALGTIFFPASADLPSLTRHFSAHLVAVTMSGLCIASFVLAAQGFLLDSSGRTILPENLAVPAGAIDHRAAHNSSAVSAGLSVYGGSHQLGPARRGVLSAVLVPGRSTNASSTAPIRCQPSRPWRARGCWRRG